MQSLTAKDIGQKAVNSKEKMLVMFRADWCPFCRRFRPIFESYESKTKIKLAEALVNEDENPMWGRFSIEVIPTLIAFQDGKEIGRRDSELGIGLNENGLKSLLKEISK